MAAAAAPAPAPPPPPAAAAPAAVAVGGGDGGGGPNWLQHHASGAMRLASIRDLARLIRQWSVRGQ